MMVMFGYYWIFEINNLLHSPGDCQLSEWSEFSACDCASGVTSKTRRRQIVVDPVPSARQCDSLIQKKRCDCPEYRLQYGDWLSCNLVVEGEDEEDTVRTCGAGRNGELYRLFKKK